MGSSTLTAVNVAATDKASDKTRAPPIFIQCHRDLNVCQQASVCAPQRQLTLKTLTVKASAALAWQRATGSIPQTHLSQGPEAGLNTDMDLFLFIG